MNAKSKILLIGLGAFSWERGKTIFEGGQMPGLTGPRQSARFFPVRFEAPCLRSAWWTTVATGVRAYQHGIWSDFSPTSLCTHVDSTLLPIWNRFKKCGWTTAVIGWPGEELRAEKGHWVAGEAFLNGGIGENALLASGDFRVKIDEVHMDVLESLVPRWREATPKQNENLYQLKRSVAALYSAFHAAKVALALSEKSIEGVSPDAGLFVALNHCFLTLIESTFGKFKAPRRSGIDGHDWALFQGLPERALGLIDILVGDLIRTFGPDTTALILFEPELAAYSWEPQYGAGVIRSAENFKEKLNAPGSAESVARYLCSVADLQTNDFPSNDVSPPVVSRGDLSPDEAFHGGVAFASAGLWQNAQSLLEQAQIACPENPYTALELARVRYRLGQPNGASEALEVALDHRDLPDFALELTELKIAANAAIDFTKLELRTPVGNEADRLYRLAGTAEGFIGPVRPLILMTCGSFPRIVGGVVLEAIPGLTRGRVRIFLGRRWQSRKDAAALLVKGATAEARRLRWEGCYCELFDAADLATTLQELSYGLNREDQRWWVPFDGIYARSLSTWQRMQKRVRSGFLNLGDEPRAEHWLASLDLADAYHLLTGPMRDALKNPTEASRTYRSDLCQFIYKDGDLAAVLLSRELSPTRIFVQLRAVSPKFLSESRYLNAELLMQVLRKGLAKNVEAYELSARAREEAETIAMARRSGGVQLSVRHVFEWPVVKSS